MAVQSVIPIFNKVFVIAIVRDAEKRYIVLSPDRKFYHSEKEYLVKCISFLSIHQSWN